jgi:hypothetical protein
MNACFAHLGEVRQLLRIAAAHAQRVEVRLKVGD